jgi:ribosomal protein L16/L10AE
MGKGKGNFKYWFSSVRRGQIIMEIKGCESILARHVLRQAIVKFRIRAVFFNKFNRWIL